MTDATPAHSSGNASLRATVVVVGAGPVGLALANELGWRNVDCLIVDAGDGTVTFPAGENIFSRTMEHLRRWGIAERARRLGWPPPDYQGGVVFATRATGHVLARFGRDTPSIAGLFAAASPEPPLMQAKFVFDPFLREAATTYGSVRLRYGFEVVGIDQDDDGVTVTGIDIGSGRTVPVRASYVAACDGGRSFVRGHLGVSFEGEFAQGHNYAVFFRAPQLLPLLIDAGIGPASQIQTVASPRRPYLTVVDGRELWRCSVYLGADDTEPDPYDVIREAVGVDLPVEVIRAQPWSGHRVVADRYQVGRVFLAGDAAHLRWPKGGFGANTGIGDAVDLGWKLAAVTSGWGGEALLASYELERRPIAVRNGDWAAENWEADNQIPSGPLLEEETTAGEAARREAAALVEKFRRKEYATVGVQLGYRYDGSPICVPDAADAPPDRSDVYVPSTCAGCRAPHAWLADGTSTLDHFGRGFTLVRTVPRVDSEPLELAAATRGVPLSVLDIDSPVVAELYEEPLVLVRPDGHVAWRGRSLPEDVAGLVDIVRGAARASPGPSALDGGCSYEVEKGKVS
jgi:2-polyprenyl-6-methoxyphenol hydroxylase-like FAD-dependent oxidoreductase